ncbi:SANT/Myb-like DNA-binding domain-containing protein [Vibrio parahaemolyticus]|nr:SANT/Myb-like DNA-binding domain-containing protein [Vibrio parahaemolyticus]
MAATRRKRNFSETEIEVLVDEVSARRETLFGGHSSGITNKRKATEWHAVATAVSAAGTERSVAEIKKKWSDLKVEAKKSGFAPPERGGYRWVQKTHETCTCGESSEAAL